MAYKVASTTGNWSVAGTWDSVVNTPTIHASTNITISTSNLFTATFTAPNLVDACNGCLLYIVAPGTAGHNITVTLQDNTVDTTATQTLSFTDIKANSWVYFRFATPYTFLSLVAGRYRFKVVSSGSGTHTGAADSGATNLAYLATTNATGVPAATDYVFITSQNLGAAITLTMDGTQTIGSGAETGNPSTTFGRSIGQAVQVLFNGLLSWDITVDSTLTSLGNVVVANGGELRIGTVGSPVGTARLEKLRFNENGVSGNYGVTQLDGGKVTLQGTPKSSTAFWKTKYVSGAGTAASPLVTADAVNWVVGDEVWICPASANATNYQETDIRYVITVNSPTSYIVSLTKGGAEAALTYTHSTDAWILNMERNVVIDTTNIAQACYYSIFSLTKNNTDIDWTRIETMGVASAYVKSGVVFNGATAAANIDYTVLYRPLFRAFASNGNDVVQTFTGIITGGQNTASFSATFDLQNSVNNKTFIDCFAVNHNRSGWSVTGANNLFLQCYAIGCNTVGLSNLAGWIIVSAYASRFNDCEAHCNRIQAFILGNQSDITFNNFLCGTKGTNAIDITLSSASYIESTFVSSNFNSATFVAGYSTMLQGSTLKFHQWQDTANNHLWYTPNGIVRSTGAGLSDTTVRSAGTLNARFASESLDIGTSFSYLVLAKAQSYVQASGFIYENADFVADPAASVTVEFYLPGSTYPDSSQLMTLTTDANSNNAVYALTGYYSATEPAYATVKIIVRTATASAYAYLADIFNGTNEITNLNTWYKGQPSPIMFEQLGDAAAVWAVQRTTSVTAGSFGEYVNADAIKISGDTTAADTLESQFDGTGLSGDTYPSRQDQLDNIVATGAAINQIAEAFTLTDGAVTSGTFASTFARNSVYHQITDGDGSNGTIDCYYQFDIGEDGVPTGTTFYGRVNGANDLMRVYGWNFTTTAWVQVGTVGGIGGVADSATTFAMFTSMVSYTGFLVGPAGATTAGKAFIRLEGTGLTAADYYVDQIYMSYAVVRRSIGYSNGAIWIDTINGIAGTTGFINGTADNPCLTLADALTLSASLKLNIFQIANGSTLTFASTIEKKTFLGSQWILDLGGQEINNSFIQGAYISGTATSGVGSTEVRIRDCDIDGATLPPCCVHGSGFDSTITLGAVGNYFFDQCFSEVAGDIITNSPIIDFAVVGACDVALRHYAGSVKIKNMTALDRCTIAGTGIVILDATCTGGVVAIRGAFELADESGLVTIYDDARAEKYHFADQVWDEAAAGHVIAGSTSKLLIDTGIKVDDNQALIIST